MLLRVHVVVGTELPHHEKHCHKSKILTVISILSNYNEENKIEPQKL